MTADILLVARGSDKPSTPEISKTPAVPVSQLSGFSLFEEIHVHQAAFAIASQPMHALSPKPECILTIA